MTQEPTWTLLASEFDDGPRIDAAIEFPDSSVAISVAAPDMLVAISRFGDLINGWKKYLPEPDPDRVVYDRATIARLLKGPSK